MLPHLHPTIPSGRAPDRLPQADRRPTPDRIRRTGGLTLVEVMCALFILALFMLGFISTMIQSRRITESAVIQSAATSTIYGLLEQMKGLDYSTQIPWYDTSDSTFKVTLRQDQDTDFKIPVRYTQSGTTPKAPTVCPDISVAAADAGASPGALDYNTGDITMSTVTGTKSQKLKLQVWVWIDEIPDTTKDVSDVKRITVVYTYSFNDGSNVKTIRDMEVFLRTNYDL